MIDPTVFNYGQSIHDTEREFILGVNTRAVSIALEAVTVQFVQNRKIAPK